jgi:hypothetical protein
LPNLNHLMPLLEPRRKIGGLAELTMSRAVGKEKDQ